MDNNNFGSCSSSLILNFFKTLPPKFLMNPKTAIKQIKLLTENIKEMRLAAEEWKSDFEILISTILSARTRDEMTIPVAEKLFKIYPTPKKLANAPINKVKLIIKPINFYKNKSKYIIACAKELLEQHGGKVPHDFDKLIELSGVGRKTANVFLAEHGKHAIPVDTHVFYISRKLGWAKDKNPHKVEQELGNYSQKNIGTKLIQLLSGSAKHIRAENKKIKF